MRDETRHSLVLVAGTGFSLVLGLVYRIYAGKHLGAAEFGDFTVAVSFFSMAVFFVGPVNGAVTRFASLYAAQGAWGKARTLSRAVLWRVLLFSALGALLGAAFVKPLAEFLKCRSPWPLVAALIIVVLNGWTCVTRGVMRGAHRFGQYNSNLIVDAGTRLLIGVAFLAAAPNAFAGLLAYVVALGVAGFVGHRQNERMWRGVDSLPISGGEIRTFALWLAVAAFCAAAFQNIDMLFVKRRLLGIDAGRYGAAATLAQAIGFLNLPFTTLSLPLLTSLHHRGKGTLRPLARICGYFVVLAGVPLLAFWLWPDRILGIFRKEYQSADAVAALGPLAAGLLIGGLSSLIATAFTAANRFRFVSIYVSGLAAEMLLLYFLGKSGQSVAYIALIVKAAIFIVLAAYFVATHPPVKEEIQEPLAEG